MYNFKGAAQLMALECCQISGFKQAGLAGVLEYFLVRHPKRSGSSSRSGVGRVLRRFTSTRQIAVESVDGCTFG